MDIWALCVVVILSITLVSGQGCIEAEPGEDSVVVESQYGCGVLDCYNQSSNVSMYANYEFAGWILRDLTIINTTYNDSRIWSEEDPEHWTLTITNVSTHDAGLYHCIVNDIYTREVLLIKLGLNVKGPFFLNKWDQYRTPTIIGCSAFAIFIGVVVAMVLIWHFRYQSPEDEFSDAQDVVFDNESFTEKSDIDGDTKPPFNGIVSQNVSPTVVVSELSADLKKSDDTSLSPNDGSTKESVSVHGYDAKDGVDNPAFAADIEMNGLDSIEIGQSKHVDVITEL